MPPSKRKQTAPAKNKRIYWYLFFLIAISINIYLLYSKYKEDIAINDADSAYFNAFGIGIPSNYSINGIDVSNYQGYINWKMVKEMDANGQKIGFAFIKATEGLSDEDKQFKRNWQLSATVKIPRGAYHFFLATKSGKKQAANFIKSVQLSPGDFPPVLDVEKLYDVKPVLMRKRVKECLDSLEAFYKVKPIIYSYADFYSNYLGKEFDDYPLWVAHYLTDKQPRINRNWIIWQHSEQGRVNGIASKVDFNVLNGDTTFLKRLLIQ